MHLYKTLIMTEIHSLMLLFAGAYDKNMLKSMNRCIKRIAPSDVNT